MSPSRLVAVALSLGLAAAIVPLGAAGRAGAVPAAAPAQATGETPSPTSPITPTVSVSATATMTATAAATSTPTLSPTPRATPTPGPVYLPLSVREPSCTPVETYVDVLFVMDGSSYMANFRGGKPAWDQGLDMVRAFLEAMDFTPDPAGKHDQAGMLVFRHRPDVLPAETLQLTGSLADARAFVDRLEYGDARDTARMDTAVLQAADMLRGSRHRPTNRQLLVFISELQPKNVPYRREPGCENLDENCTMLKRAEEVKAMGITFVVLATGQTARADELNFMASDPSLVLILPTAEPLRDLYARLAPRRTCPQFWPYRP